MLTTNSSSVQNSSLQLSIFPVPNSNVVRKIKTLVANFSLIRDTVNVFMISSGRSQILYLSYLSCIDFSKLPVSLNLNSTAAQSHLQRRRPSLFQRSLQRADRRSPRIRRHRHQRQCLRTHRADRCNGHPGNGHDHVQ